MLKDETGQSLRRTLERAAFAKQKECEDLQIRLDITRKAMQTEQKLAAAAISSTAEVLEQNEELSERIRRLESLIIRYTGHAQYCGCELCAERYRLQTQAPEPSTA